MKRSHLQRLATHRILAVGVGALLAVVAFAAAGAAYRYRDANGQWVYTDRPPGDGRGSEGIALEASTAASPRMTVVPRPVPSGVALVAVNECRCAVEFAVRATTGTGTAGARRVVPEKSEAVLLELPASSTRTAVPFEYGYVIGEPGAQHRPTLPYRVPFATAAQF